MHKYNLAERIKREAAELNRIKQLSAESTARIKSNRNYSAEYIAQWCRKNEATQLEAQKRVYERADAAIKQLAVAVSEERPHEEFDFGSQKFTNALQLIEMGGKALPQEAQEAIVAQFRYCPDGLKVLAPLMRNAGMEHAATAVIALQAAADVEQSYPDRLSDAFWYACNSISDSSDVSEIERMTSMLNGYVHSPDIFNAAPGVADEPTDEENVAAAARETSYAAQLRANEVAAEKLADIQQ